MSQTELGSEEWRGERGVRWASDLDRMEAMLAPVDEALIGLLNLDRPLRIADIGSGGGTTARRLHDLSPEGSKVHGHDISAELVAAARERQGTAHLAFHLSNAETDPFDAGPFDLITSRFGVMFFSDPLKAFQNIANALVPGGQIAFAVWGKPQDNIWMTAAKSLLEDLITIEMPAPDAPGPFRYGDIDLLLGLLRDAGLSTVASTDWTGTLAIGGGLSPADATAFWLQNMKDMADRLNEAGDAIFQEGKARLTRFYTDNLVDGIVRLPAHVHLVTAKRD